VFKKACHHSLFWIRWIHSTTPHPTSLRSILILFCHLCYVFAWYYRKQIPFNKVKSHINKNIFRLDPCSYGAPSPADGSIRVPLLLPTLEDSSYGLYVYYFLGEAKSSSVVSRGAAMQGEQYSPPFPPPPSAHKSTPRVLLPLLVLYSWCLHLWTALRQTTIPLRNALLFFRVFLFFWWLFLHCHRLLLSFIYRKEMNALYYVPQVLSIMECKPWRRFDRRH